MLPELLLSNIAQAYILPVLDAQGFRSLSSTEQEKLLQPLIEGAVIRIVAGISQHLPPEGQTTFKDLHNRSEATPQIWEKFWHQYLPDYQTIVKDILTTYQEELQTTFAV
jgi:hypothetical protein